MKFAMICLGGALGTGARVLFAEWALRLLGSGFPYGILIVNILGSFLLGLLMGTGLAIELLSPSLRTVLATGVLGGFTTYSTFNYQTLEYLEAGEWRMGALYIASTLVLSLLAGALGILSARAMVGT